MNITDMISKGYQASSMIRVCTRALDADTPAQAGDEGAIADALNTARDMVDALIDGVDALQTTPRLATPCDMLRQWKALRASQTALAAQDPTPPEMDAVDAQVEAMGEGMAGSTPTTLEDAAAMLEWCLIDSEGEIKCDLYPKAHRAVIAYLHKVTA